MNEEIRTIVDKYLNDLGFNVDAVTDVVVAEETGTLKITVKINTDLWKDVPFLSGGRILAIFQRFVDKLPRDSAGKKLDWIFVPDKVIEASEKKDIKYDEEQIKMGIEVEKEHKDVYDYLVTAMKTDIDPNLEFPLSFEEFCSRIAQAHLREMPDYYTKLKKMEKTGAIKTAQMETGDASILNTAFGKIGEVAMKSGLLDVAIAYQIGKHILNQILPHEERKKLPFWR